MMRLRKVNAITLVEAIVSISIIGATVGMAAAFIKYHEPTIRLHGAAAELRGELLEARSLALSLQVDHGLVFRIDEEAYDLAVFNGAPQVTASTTLSQGITFVSAGPFTDNAVRFNAAGAASQGGTIILQNVNGATKQIIINPSGYVSIQ
ncbi:MAG: GspH/FimT family protein [Parcubacteria group bacterium]|nr:GspH/FimT family protein [Parcubacteria group bacterium]